MGALYQHNVQEYITQYNLNNYVETGTGAGDCLRHALQFNFSKLRSVEIYPQIFERYNSVHRLGSLLIDTTPMMDTYGIKTMLLGLFYLLFYIFRFALYKCHELLLIY
jgi:hypothetical protein